MEEPLAPLIELRGVTRSFLSHGQTVPVLESIDLHVPPRASICLRGASGSGKSTLLSILALIDGAYQGTYTFDGKDVREMSDATRSMIRLVRIGVAFQDLYLVESLTVLENVEVPLVAAGASRAHARDRAQELLEKAGIAHRAEQAPRVLSGGERRRAAFVRALANRPRLLLLDEPTAELDAESAEAILNLIRLQQAEGASVVVATHDPRLQELCREHFRLRKGRIETGPVAQRSP